MWSCNTHIFTWYYFLSEFEKYEKFKHKKEDVYLIDRAVY